MTNSVPLNILTFPIWWYAVGAQTVWRWFFLFTRRQFTRSGLVLFFRHMREPLYGDYTRSGILISFFLRVVLLIGMILFSVFKIFVAFCIFLAFLFALPLAVVMAIYQLFGMLF